MGYLAPEYTTTGRFTDRSDVYAFGVVVFQVLTGRKAVSSELCLLGGGGAEYSGKLDDLVDPCLGGQFSRPACKEVRERYEEGREEGKEVEEADVDNPDIWAHVGPTLTQSPRIEYQHSSKANKAALVHQNTCLDKILMEHLFVPHLSGVGEYKLDSAAMGYLAPEYTTTGRFTDRSDVYAFGVVVFQVLTGRKAVSSELCLLGGGGAEYSGKLDDLVDPCLGGQFSRPACKEVRERYEEGREEGKEVEEADVDNPDIWAHVGPTLTQSPRRPKPRSKPPKDLG
uniref:Protein kinase domain-containing protein n=1 Tax=Oryza meridionalis TaxID=40149 RepID=A0A0E0ERS0_9ORYZ